ncbi:hypothetical protein ABN584_18785 [Gloeocapsa sp. BRSZ]
MYRHVRLFLRRAIAVTNDGIRTAFFSPVICHQALRTQKLKILSFQIFGTLNTQK